MTATNRVEAFEETVWLLDQWARWSKVNPCPSLSLPSVTPYRRLLGSSLPSPTIDEETAMLVDSVVARLLQRDPEVGKAVIFYYRGSRSISAVSEQIRKPRWRVDGWIKTGTSWLDGALQAKK